MNACTREQMKWLVRYELASSWAVWLPLPNLAKDFLAGYYGRLVARKMARLSRLQADMKEVES